MRYGTIDDYMSLINTDLPSSIDATATAQSAVAVAERGAAEKESVGAAWPTYDVAGVSFHAYYILHVFISSPHNRPRFYSRHVGRILWVS